MKNLLPLSALIPLLLCPAFAAEKEWHTFTNQGGRQLEAMVLRVDGQVVTLERKSDGRQFALKFEDLSEDDRKWLNVWNQRSKAQAESGNSDSSEDAIGDGDLGEASTRLYPKTREEIRSTLREIEKRPIPEGINEAAGQATNLLNQYRYLCGVPDQVASDEKMNAQSTEAAKACEEHGSLSHSIGHFTNICNLSGGGNPVSSVRSYMQDGGANNRADRGHRRWCLNPPMGKVGFGGSGRFSAMACMDRSGGGRMRDSWAYPAKGFFPADYLHGDGWSLYLTGGAPAKDKLTVQVFRLGKRPEKPPTWADDAPGQELDVNFVSTYQNAINFEPEGLRDSGVYWVRIRGGGVREQYLVELY